MTNTIVAGNAAASSPDLVGMFQTAGTNVVGDIGQASGLADGVATGDELEELVAKQAERLSRISPSINAENKRNLRRLTASIGEDMGSDSRFAQYVTDEFLGEGIGLLVGQRSVAAILGSENPCFPAIEHAADVGAPF